MSRKYNNIINQAKVVYQSTHNYTFKADHPGNVYRYLADHVYDPMIIECVEHFYVLHLLRNKRLRNIQLVSIGSTDFTIVDAKIIFSCAILSLSDSIILSHNHPSGSCEPSPNDIQITNKLIKVGNLLDIKVIDHIIITKDGYYSFEENGKI